MHPRFIVSLYFSYVSHSGGVIDVAKNLIAGLSKTHPNDFLVLRPAFEIKNKKFRTLMRYAADFLVSFRFYFSKTVVLFPNFLCLPLPFSRAKNVVVVHDLLFKHYPQYINPIKRVVFNINYKLVQKFADGVVFISQDTQDDFLARYGKPKRYTTIYNPIVLKGAGADVVRTVGPMDKPYVIANFHYYPHKNIEQLLDVFAQLHAQWPELQIVFTGNKPPEFDALVAPNAARGAIAHLGFLPKDQVMALIRDAAFFMSMSQFEGFNMSAAEAALLNKPLVLSDIPVHRELFTECSYFVDLNSRTVDIASIVDFVQQHKPSQPAFAAQVQPEVVAQRYWDFIDEVSKG